jgi:hypothetical protein
VISATLVSVSMTGEQVPSRPGHSVPERERSEAFPVPDWASLVSGIRDGDSAAMAELYGIFAKGIRYFLLRNLGPDDLDDKVHDCFVIVTQAIQNGDLREPERLMGYVRTVVKRQIALRSTLPYNGAGRASILRTRCSRFRTGARIRSEA